MIKYLLTEQKQQRENQFQKNRNYLNIRLCLLGPSCSGKKTLGITLKNQYGIELIQVGELL